MLPRAHSARPLHCLNQWEKLQAFLLDDRLEIDNNRAERSIKPFVIGRKNWLFANTPRGARVSAILYSIVETAKENGLSRSNTSPICSSSFQTSMLPIHLLWTRCFPGLKPYQKSAEHQPEAKPEPDPVTTLAQTEPPYLGVLWFDVYTGTS